MRKAVLGAIAAISATVAVAMFAVPARSQIVASPSFVPIGTSSSGSGSTVWFHEPSSRQVVACQAASQGAGGLSIQCARAALPN